MMFLIRVTLAILLLGSDFAENNHWSFTPKLAKTYVFIKLLKDNFAEMTVFVKAYYISIR